MALVFFVKSKGIVYYRGQVGGTPRIYYYYKGWVAPSGGQRKLSDLVAPAIMGPWTQIQPGLYTEPTGIIYQAKISQNSFLLRQKTEKNIVLTFHEISALLPIVYRI